MKGIQSITNFLRDMPPYAKIGLYILTIPVAIAIGTLIGYKLDTPSTPRDPSILILQRGDERQITKKDGTIINIIYDGGAGPIAIFKTDQTSNLELAISDCLNHDNGKTNSKVEDVTSDTVAFSYPVKDEDCNNIY